MSKSESVMRPSSRSGSSQRTRSPGLGGGWKPTEDQILQYCEFLEMDMEKDAHLKYIAADALTAPIPPPWKEYETPDGYVYYVNTVTGKSSWEHPLDGFYKDMYYEAKRADGKSGSTSKLTVDAQAIAAKDRKIEELQKEITRLRGQKKTEGESSSELRKRLEELTQTHEKNISALKLEHKQQTMEMQKQQEAIKTEIRDLNEKAEESKQQVREGQDKDKKTILNLNQKVFELTELVGTLKVEAVEAGSLREKLESREMLLKQAEAKANQGLSDLNEKLELTRKHSMELETTNHQLVQNLKSVKEENGKEKKEKELVLEENKKLTLEVEAERLRVAGLQEENQREHKRLKRLDERYIAKEAEAKELMEKVASLGEELKNLKAKDVESKNKIDTLQKVTSEGLNKDHAKCLQEFTNVSMRCKNLEGEVKKVSHDREAITKKLMKLQATVAKVESERRAALNRLQDLQGNIRVMCRLRPMLRRERRQSITSLSLTQKHITCAPSTGGVDIIESGKDHSFQFNHVFQNASQTEVFTQVSDLIQSALDGYNVCLFAYGQTGSGKTFTMQGDDGKNQGIIPRAVKKILDVAEQKKVQGWEFKLQGSFLEIYNEQVRDLLIPNSPNLDIKIVTSSSNSSSSSGKSSKVQTHVPGLTRQSIKSALDISTIMDTAAKNRSVAATDMNLHSSRSHSVFTLYMSGKNEHQGLETSSALYLCDLAGSERLAKSGVEGARRKEAVMINKSLSALSDVFQALARGDSHVPFRNSKLTYLLQCCFVGNGKTLMFVNLSPNPNSANESLCSLRFAQKVNQCVMGPAQKQTSKVKKTSALKPPSSVSSRTRTRPLIRGKAKPPPGVPKYARKNRRQKGGSRLTRSHAHLTT